MTKTTEPKRNGMAELALYFLRLGFLGFGGPVALVGQMERELVTDKKWLSKKQMRESIAICQSLPGPLAIQVGIYVAWVALRVLGRLARRVVLHPAQLRHRGRVGRALRLPRRSSTSDGDLLRRQPGRDRTHPAFLL